MKKFLAAVFLFLTLALALPLFTGASVTVSSPTSGTTVTSPVHIIASDQNATHMNVYVDGKKVYGEDTQSIDTKLYMSTGTHNVVVQSWDRYGNIDKYPLSVTVASSSYDTDSYSHYLGHLDELTMTTCGNCGNSLDDGSPTGATAYYKQSFVSNPALDGKASKFYLDAPYGSYSNAYWYRKWWSLDLGDGIDKLLIQFRLWIPASYVDNYQAIEFEAQENYSTHKYNLAWQYVRYSHKWKTFDFTHKKWVDTGIYLAPLSGGQWHAIVAEFTLDHYHHTRTTTALYIDGQVYVPTMNRTLPATYVSGSSSRTLSAAFQLDSNKYGDPYHVYVDQWAVRYDK